MRLDQQKMKKLFAIALVLHFGILYAQLDVIPSNGYKITYQRSSNGKVLENQDPILVFAATNQTTLLTSAKIQSGKMDFPYEQTFIDLDTRNFMQLAFLSKDKNAATIDSTSLSQQTFDLSSDTKTILGYKCRKAKTVVNSNTIELWFTTDLKVKGAPTVLGADLGLVLEMVRNNNYVITATKIEKQKKISPHWMAFNTFNGPTTDLLTYRDLLWKSRFTTISVFQDETLRFSDQSKSNDSILRYANGTVILRKVNFPEIPVGSLIFAELQEQSNGDAYDRTGSVFIIPEDQPLSFLDGLKNGVTSLPVYDNGNGKQYQGVIRSTTYSPLLELMRFFTPFGIKQYNHIALKGKKWHEIVPYRQDISELQPVLSHKTVWVGTFIGNYDKGGHTISLDVTIHKGDKPAAGNRFVLPLFNTTNVMEMAGQDYATMFNTDKGLEVTFDLPNDVSNAQLRYITTGHGGWENGDEFVPKKNRIFLDQQEVFAFTPWRHDCGSYRLFNPASGNFNNGLSSSDYSRSNWCPGTVTNPIMIDLGDLKAGKHTIQVRIPQGAPEGNSFSSWNVSGVLIGN